MSLHGLGQSTSTSNVQMMTIKRQKTGGRCSARLGAGFTLLELLIVIAIIAILSVILIIVINPAETLKKSRDSQRISDLATLKTAVGIYTTTTSTVTFGDGTSNTPCKTGSGGGSYVSGDEIYYSVATSTGGTPITDATLDAGSGSTPAPAQVTSSSLALTDGTGWLPINFEQLTGGSPISNLPIDPTNSVPDGANVSSTALVYRYACNATSLTYELDTVLESTAFTVDDNKMAKDGGNTVNYYEVGTNLKILGASAGGTDY